MTKRKSRHKIAFVNTTHTHIWWYLKYGQILAILCLTFDLKVIQSTQAPTFGRESCKKPKKKKSSTPSLSVFLKFWRERKNKLFLRFSNKTESAFRYSRMTMTLFRTILWLLLVNSFFKNGPTPASFLFIFGLFKQKSLQFLQQINVKKCPSSIWCWDWNPRPFEHESSPITTRPGLPPFHVKLLKKPFANTRSSYFSFLTDYPFPKITHFQKTNNMVITWSGSFIIDNHKLMSPHLINHLPILLVILLVHPSFDNYSFFFFFIGPFPASFSLFSSFQYSW